MAKAVGQGELAYVGKSLDGKYVPFKFNESLFAGDVEVVEEMFLITRETATAFLKQQAKPATDPGAAPAAAPVPPASSTPATTTPTTVQTTFPVEATTASTGGSGLSWTGEIPTQKWMNFYTKVLSKFASERSLKLTLDGGSHPRRRPVPAKA